MASRVVVTGMGIVSGIGIGLEETRRSLLERRHGIGPVQFVPTRLSPELSVSEVKHSTDDLRRMAALPTGDATRTTLLGLLAARQALEAAGLERCDDDRTGFVSATTVAGMDRTERHFRDLVAGSGDPSVVDTNDPGDSTGRIADALGIGGLVTTVSTACTSAANALITGALLIRAGRLERVIAGGADALCRFALNGFNSLRILDSQWCRPFDEERRGLNIGEAGAYLVLESEESARTRGRLPLAEVTGWANTNDAFHQTASSANGDGAYEAMAVALAVAGLPPGAIGWVNAHGTGTENNDLSELHALVRLFGGELPPFSSTKSYTGHALGAAGAVEAVIAVLALEGRVIFPNLNFRTPMKEFHRAPVTEVLSDASLKHVLSTSLGFGGNCSALLFSRA